eukprot:GILJ01025929.1.p1 GENE.GILJ01025929.1~~GILJ01025929.1.p1  ORF type:complete len:421 (-),score=39.42 GILJ01025929.1:52-1167(-)
MERLANENGIKIDSYSDILCLKDRGFARGSLSALEGCKAWNMTPDENAASLAIRSIQLEKMMTGQRRNQAVTSAITQTTDLSMHTLAHLVRSTTLAINKTEMLLHRRADLVVAMGAHAPADYILCCDKSGNSFNVYEDNLSQTREFIDEELNIIKRLIPARKSVVQTQERTPSTMKTSHYPNVWERSLLETLRHIGAYSSPQGGDTTSKTDQPKRGGRVTLVEINRRLEKIRSDTNVEWNHLLRTVDSPDESKLLRQTLGKQLPFPLTAEHEHLIAANVRDPCPEFVSAVTRHMSTLAEESPKVEIVEFLDSLNFSNNFTLEIPASDVPSQKLSSTEIEIARLVAVNKASTLSIGEVQIVIGDALQMRKSR